MTTDELADALEAYAGGTIHSTVYRAATRLRELQAEVNDIKGRWVLAEETLSLLAVYDPPHWSRLISKYFELMRDPERSQNSAMAHTLTMGLVNEARAARDKAEAEVTRLREALQQADRIVLTSGVVGGYDGAYDRLSASDYANPEYSLGYHQPEWGQDSGYTVVIALKRDLLTGLDAVTGEKR